MSTFTQYKDYRKNKPIISVLEAFANKDRGKVVESRKEIQQRFAYQDWSVQKKIMRVFLESGKYDREWTLSKLLVLWDEEFEPLVRELWESLHEERAAWVIIRHFPVSYIEDHIDALSTGRNYFFICQRLGANLGSIDRTKLSDSDYLSLMAFYRHTISYEEAIDILFCLVHRRCTSILPYYDFPNVPRPEIISMMNFPEFRKAINDLWNVDCGKAVEVFEKWNSDVKDSIKESAGFKTPSETVMSDQAYCMEATGLCFVQSYQSLADKYKMTSDPSLEEMMMPTRYYRVILDDNNLDPSEMPF